MTRIPNYDANASGQHQLSYLEHLIWIQMPSVVGHHHHTSCLSLFGMKLKGQRWPMFCLHVSLCDGFCHHTLWLCCSTGHLLDLFIIASQATAKKRFCWISSIFRQVVAWERITRFRINVFTSTIPPHMLCYSRRHKCSWEEFMTILHILLPLTLL